MPLPTPSAGGGGAPRQLGRRLQEAASPPLPGEQAKQLPEFLLPPLPPQASSLASAILIGLGGWGWISIPSAGAICTWSNGSLKTAASQPADLNDP